MIIAWVLSLMILLSSLVAYLERLSTLQVLSINTLYESQKQFMAAEKNLLDCEQHLSQIANLENRQCHIQSAGKNWWLISNTEKPLIEVLVYLDDNTGLATRLNWRQDFE
jgi:hypothetical protein